MPRLKLRQKELVLLGRLDREPIEIGEVSARTAENIASLGLARRVLGSYEITSTGQLELRRQRFMRTPGQKLARVTRQRPVFLHEARFRGNPLSRERLNALIENLHGNTVKSGDVIGAPGYVARFRAAVTDHLRRWRKGARLPGLTGAGE